MSELITDDEVVALALHASVPWRGLLPTVTVTADELQRAAFRGARSLSVRGLDADGPGGAKVTDARAAVSAVVPIILAFTAHESAPLVAGSTGVGVFGTPSPEVVVDVTLPAGVHEFGTVPRQRARDVLRGLVASYRAQGSARGDGYLLTFLASGTIDQGSSVALVGRSGATSHRTVIDASGQTVLESLQTEADVDAVIDQALPDVE